MKEQSPDCKEDKTEILNLKYLSKQFVNISQKVRPAVVNIITSKQINTRMQFTPSIDPFDDNEFLSEIGFLQLVIRLDLTKQ
ncbi:hypothetical protein HZA55_01430 [Candidatus Poribacteria bacterium]|nr:hypothetical protein [Candidatus Poribacteria bacterium]